MMENSLTDPPTKRLSAGRRIYVVGDVHGHADKLARVHARVRADLERRPVPHPALIHLGDYIDRGPDSAGTIELLAKGPPVRGVPTINLRGNHEWMMLNALDAQTHDDIDTWLDNGGDKALHSWGLRSSQTRAEWLAGIPPRHLVLLHGLRTSFVADGYLFVHAGVRPGVPTAQQREQDMLWIRDSFMHHKGPMLPDAPHRVVVHGHTPLKAPDVLANRIGLDTGAGKGGPLTCAILEADDVDLFQVHD